MGLVTKEAFEQDKVLKEEFGSYENYLSQNGGNSDSTSSVVVHGNSEVEGGQNPTFNDYVSVENSGKLPEEEPKSAYDMYMEEEKNIYNQGVETNNKNAANQAASAGAQYRELNRNINEINKANGRANTGYAGDTSIDAYNAYRNSVNKSYSDANSANNELYSYYLTKMTELQQAKDTKEAMEYNKIYGEGGVMDRINNYLKNEETYDEDKYLTGESARRIYNYVYNLYEGNIPSEIMAELESEKGFSEWLKAYNEGNEDNYIHTKSWSKQYKNKVPHTKISTIVDGSEYDSTKVDVGNVLTDSNGNKWKVTEVIDNDKDFSKTVNKKGDEENYSEKFNIHDGEISKGDNGTYYVALSGHGNWAILEPLD